VPCGSGPTLGARPLGDCVESGYLRDGSPSVWSRDKESPGMGSLPPYPAICKNESTRPVPYAIGATVSDILMVNSAGVIDVY